MVDRCLRVEAECVKVEGEKAATVGGFASPLGPGEAFWEDLGGEDMWSIQGRSTLHVRMNKFAMLCRRKVFVLPSAAMQSPRQRHRLRLEGWCAVFKRENGGLMGYLGLVRLQKCMEPKMYLFRSEKSARRGTVCRRWQEHVTAR
jgi:hypothetical protein